MALRHGLVILVFLAIGCRSDRVCRSSSEGGDSGPKGTADGGAEDVPVAEDGAGDSAVLFDFSGLDVGILNAPVLPAGLDAATSRAAKLLKTLSLDQKGQLVHGVIGPYVGNVAGVAGLPALTLQDGPAGVARFTGVTAFPAPITLAATWDRDLVRRWGAAMGAQMRGKGVMIQLAPMMNLARSPAAGRNFEGFGEDPFLSAELAAADVVGIQSQRVVATAKHYVGNEQETNRDSGDSQIDERTLHEVYYAPFEAAVNAGVGAVMGSYNRLNGRYACENPTSLADLKVGMGFTGWVMTDWGASTSTVGGANAGLDMVMPDDRYFGSELVSAVSAGTVSQARLDDMVSRILSTLLRVGVFDDPPSGAPSSDVASSSALAKEAAMAGITLLKNAGAALPLDATIKSIAVIGVAGGNAPASGGGGSAEVTASEVVSPFSAIQAQASKSVTVTYSPGTPATQDQAVAAAAAADAAIVFQNVASTEGYDRTSLALASNGDALIAAVAAVNPRTIVVLNVPGAVLMPWLDLVSAVLVDWYPGEQNGNAIAPILFGTANPMGKLPVTFPRNATDLPQVSEGSEVPYSEGLAIGYRGLDARGIEPLFPFGQGLSYTTFKYSDLHVRAGAAPGSLAVEFTLQNAGSLDGSEVAQLYLSFPAAAGEPPLLLRGFERVSLPTGGTRMVTIELGPRHLSCWNVAAHARYVPSGTYGIAVGGASRDLPLQTSVQIVGFGPQN